VLSVFSLGRVHDGCVHDPGPVIMQGCSSKGHGFVVYSTSQKLTRRHSL
jgi:hypothetical protein